MSDTHSDTGSTVQYLSFLLGGERYAVDVLKVQEIRSFEKATRIPHSPEYVLGILNLRGAVVPVVDLRLRFGMEAEFDATTVTILLRMFRDGKERTVGVVVDSVSDVHDIGSGQKQIAPDVGGSVGTEFVESLATIGDDLLIILDIDHLLASGVLARIDAEAGAGQE